MLAQYKIVELSKFVFYEYDRNDNFIKTNWVRDRNDVKFFAFYVLLQFFVILKSLDIKI